MSHTVRFAPEALIQLDDLETYIGEVASPDVAARYVDRIVDFCESLSMFPEREPGAIISDQVCEHLGIAAPRSHSS